MSIELRPLGVTCNIACQYCYQNPQRDAGNFGKKYDLEAMKAAILQEGGSFTLFGGEPLLLPEGDLEHIWAWGLETFGSNHIQTNGTLINENHIRMFRKYKVHVGISLDGPGELNDVRWNGDLVATRQATAKVENTIDRLCQEGLTPSLIVTLHRNNATGGNLLRMHEWLRQLDRKGIQFARLHILEVDDDAVRSKYALSAEENVKALLSFALLEKELSLRMDVFSDMEKLLLGRDTGVTCVWRACDPWTTEAVRGIEGHGQRSNCGRTNKEGIDFVKAETAGYERYLALFHTPQEQGGCSGCRFYLACKGQCPGTAINGDWRNRTEHCKVWMALLEEIEGRLIAQGHQPISRSEHRESLERRALASWAAGLNPSVQSLVKRADEPPSALTQMPDFLRSTWVSDHARDTWKPKLKAIQDAWPLVVLRSVQNHPGKCSVRTIPSWQIFRLQEDANRAGVALAVLGIRGVATPGYAQNSPFPISGKPWAYDIALGPEESVRAIENSWARENYAAVFRCCGLPECCINAFQTDVAEKRIDATGRYAQSGHAKNLAAGMPGPLWRLLNIEPVYLSPCNLQCSEAIAQSTEAIAEAEAYGFEREMEWLKEVFSWPVEWSGLHGIGQLKTPVMKLAFTTDLTHDNLTFRYSGMGYPEEGATGLGFPYRQSGSAALTSSSAFRRGLENFIQIS